MLETQAERLIERLKSACTYHRFDEPGVYAEYTRFLMRHDYSKMEEAIDAAIEDDSRNVPAISVLAKKYKEVKDGPRAAVKNEEYCAVCDDVGVVFVKEKHQELNIDGEPLIYEHAYYCPFCAVGRSYAYDGRTISDREHRSPYHILPITAVYGDEGIQAMREANLTKQAKKADKTRSLEKAMQAVGKSMPDGWQYDVDVPF